ncbi:2-oxoglutarate-dependent dioxygenase 21, chloroplastic [Beta vulgaris subsp. vulgaris]|uniref:2-oxoglutarate-dependent dioxygenase 21, chloroplastic n=1 Tax=Beta vulgaris subsp. vulgaris TaxID=3555 RepID=UPI002036DC73|nr:2-oxoglutarate-dependent dioxygenase 21, chloroplastic [Beta vulgaris subsp. vulgaris]
MESDKCSKCFSTGQSAQEEQLAHVPDCYEVPPAQRPSLNSPQAHVPLIDLAGLRIGPPQRSTVIQSIREACIRFGFFQIINHGIDQALMDKALSAADEFFHLPTNEKMKFMSSDVHKPVRYGTSIKDGVDKIQYWRVFLKHYANPLNDWILSWPESPPNYREDMGTYSREVQKLALELTGAITESLGLNPKYLNEKMKQGMQVIVTNCYPPCPQPCLTLGLPPHSDYSCLTILLQGSPGLEVKDMQDGGAWKLVPHIDGALQIHIGDHFEVLSNGVYKSVVHRAILDYEKTRISIASLHSLGLDDKMEPAIQLLDQDHPKAYKGSSFRDFLDFLSANDIGQGNFCFLDTLKI